MLSNYFEGFHRASSIGSFTTSSRMHLKKQFAVMVSAMMFRWLSFGVESAVDKLFFPIRLGEHYICVVYNLKNPAYEILDNMIYNEDVADVYEPEIGVLHYMLCNYLTECKHHLARRFQNMDPSVLEMRWRTRQNFVDCGVFVMRHMETYMGGGTTEWKPDLTVEGPDQDIQLLELRKKYVAKILLSNNNTRKRFVEAEVAEFNELPDSEKDGMMMKARLSRSERLKP